MTDPDPMKKLFAEYTVTVTAEAPVDDANRLWRKAKRRRVGQVAAAGVAALALTGSATWAFQQAGASDEPTSAAEQGTAAPCVEEGRYALLAEGTTIEDYLAAEKMDGALIFSQYESIEALTADPLLSRMARHAEEVVGEAEVFQVNVAEAKAVQAEQGGYLLVVEFYGTFEEGAPVEVLYPCEESPTEEPTAAEEPTAEVDYTDANDLVGATVDLPSFDPGNTEVDEVCGVGDTRIVDGMYHGAGEAGSPEEGEAFILGTTFAAVTDADRAYAAEDDYDYTKLSLVGFFGCDAGDDLLFQVVVLDESDAGTWAATQLVHSEPGGESLKGMTAGDGMQLLVGFAERWDPADELDEDQYWIESVRLEEDAVVRESTDYDYWSVVIDMSPLFPVE